MTSSIVFIRSSAAYYGALNVSQASIAEYFGVATSQVTLYYTFQCLSAVCCGLLGAWLLKKFNLHGGARKTALHCIKIMIQLYHKIDIRGGRYDYKTIRSFKK